MAFKAIPVEAAKVSGSHSNFPVLVQPSVIAGLGSITLVEAQSARFYADEAKTTELAREIVSADEIWVKVASLTTTTVLYMEYDGVASDYAVTDTYGRNAVWSDYWAVWHFEGAAATAGKVADSTGNSRSLNENGGPRSIAGAFGGADGGYDMDGNNAAVSTDTGYDWLDLPGANVVLAAIGSSAFTIQGMFRPDSIPSTSWGLLYMEQNGAAGRPYARNWCSASGVFDGGVETSTGGSNDVPSVASAFVANEWSFIAIGRNASNYPFGYVDGTLTTSTTLESGSFSASNAPFYVNRRYNTSYGTSRRYGDGRYDEVRIRLSHLAEDWLDTEYNCMINNSTFWGTATDIGGGVKNPLYFGPTL